MDIFSAFWLRVMWYRLSVLVSCGGRVVGKKYHSSLCGKFSVWMFHGLIMFLLLISYGGFSQQEGDYEVLQWHNSDCPGAIFLEDTIFGPTTPPPGPGDILEISSDDWSAYAFRREHHTVWYRFVAPAYSYLSFTIEPLSVDDDYDFLLYHEQGPDFCERIRRDEVTPVRSNLSRNNKAIGSKTGLGTQGGQTHVPPGPGDDFSKPMEVSKGDTLLLVLDNVYEGGKGHVLKLSYDVITEPEPETREPVETKGPRQFLMLTVVDKASGERINGSVFMTYARSSDTLFYDGQVSHVNTRLKPNAQYQVVVEAYPYFRHQISFQTEQMDTTISITAPLTKIERGRMLTLDNLYFYSGTANFLRESYETLRNLLEVMQEYPSLKIAIYGHVNQPLQWRQRSSDEYLERLSQRRADAVKRYLVRRGIDPERMITEGKSNRKMIHPYAESEEEQSENRRVEIKVLDIKPRSEN